MLREPDQSDIESLHRAAGDGGPRGVAARYVSEPRDRYLGRAATVLAPASTAAVAEVIREARARQIGIVPYAGGTGLVGGQVSLAGPLPAVLSLERMDRIRSVSAPDNALVAEAGVILADVQSAAAAAGRLFPLSLAAEGSARIGGNLATNAGGVQVLRYGNARELCLGVEAVLPDGSVHHGLKLLRKDNMGYDLRHLLIGSEGTLGVITAAALKLFPRPAETVTAMVAVPHPAAAVGLLGRLRDRLGDGISAFELVAGQGLAFLAEHFEGWSDPLSGGPTWRVLLEVGAPPETDLANRTEAALAEAFEDGLATDGAIAASIAQAREMWWIRETIPEANRKVGAIAYHDMSVPISRIPDFISAGERLVSEIQQGLRINCFGHIGDGNLHYNIFPPEGATKADFVHLRERVTGALHEQVHRFGGSISAEHGIGRAKTGDLQRFGDPAKLAVMRSIKAALDPVGIMNPGALFGEWAAAVSGSGPAVEAGPGSEAADGTNVG
ncbi:MAG: FAD-binding oxidoreductase [Pikeienuella sp.]